MTNQTKPGDIINITVRSEPKSYVGIMGVDQSVLLLRGGNDIEKSAVTDDLQAYNYIDRYNSEWRDNSDYRYYNDFWMSNAIILTNANPEYRKILF